ncbi:MAG: cysteine hydrolase family protein [Chlorobiota bacterium]
MNLKDGKTALLLIDIQKGLKEEEYYGGNRNNPDAEKVCGRILEEWRELGLPLFHVRHSSEHPESPLYESKPGFAFADEVMPLENEIAMTKHVNSAFIGTDLQDFLIKQSIEKLVVVGLTTNHCISTSVRMADNLGYKVYLISDSTATFDTIGTDGKKYDSELVHQISLASLKDEFATIMTSDELLEVL